MIVVGHAMTHTGYQQDVVAWANEQARLIRAKQFDQLDIEHIAEEIEDVGKTEQRELASRVSVLLTHVLKWRYQPERRGNSWLRTINVQRGALKKRLKRTPSLKSMLTDIEWQEEMWADALTQAMQETDLECFPDACPWVFTQILEQDWLPE